MTNFKGIPPRKISRLRDNAARLPTVARTVSTSDRTGKHIVKAFDDTHTMIFADGGVKEYEYDVKMPIVLPNSLISNQITSFLDLSNITSSFDPNLVKAGVISGLSDIFLETPTTEVEYSPYHERFQQEQSNTSSFYMSGTSIDGFTGKLSDKTIIRLTLPHTTKYTLLSTTASIAYYNVSEMIFQRVGSVTNPSDSYAARAADGTLQSAASGITNSAAGGINYAHDARLFGPLGNMVASGSYSAGATRNFNCVSNLLGQRILGYMPEALRQNDSESVTVNSLFAASASCILPLSGILNHPFLIEKIVVEFPLSASSDWFLDTTTLNYCDTFGQDIGGPCITVALLNQFAPTHRDVIASGTIIPVGDNVSQLYNSLATTYDHNAPHGFAAFTNPTVVVSGSTAGFAGNVILEMMPAVSNGVFSTSFRTSSFETTVSSFPNSRLRMLNKFGRAMTSFGSGRSIFGGDYDANAASFDPPINSLSGNRVDTFFLNNSQHAPYIIKSTDKLILAISKHRSVARDPTTITLGGNRLALSATHTVAVDVGTVQLTLYGSLIANGRQFHMCRNEPLISQNISETIGDDYIVTDQYDAAPLIAFSGSYVDVYISGTFTGTMPDAAAIGSNDSDANRGFRRIIGSAVATTTSQPVRKFVKLDSREIIFDSFIPSPRDIQLTDNSDIVAFRQSITSSVSVLMFPLRSDASADLITAATSGGMIRENSKWPFAFPFESRYGSLKRIKFTNKTSISTSMYTLGNGPVDIFTTGSVLIGRADAIVRIKSNNHSPNNPTLEYGTSSLEHLQDANPGTYFGKQLDKGVFTKGFYGFGDNLYHQPRYIEIERIHQPSTLPNTGTHRHEFHTNVAIRGWKYGIYNGTQRATQMIVNRQHYGYLRDVMEQRQFTKLTMGDTVPREAAVICQLITTASLASSGSNFSNELTSSTPYFDGFVRN